MIKDYKVITSSKAVTVAAEVAKLMIHTHITAGFPYRWQPQGGMIALERHRENSYRGGNQLVATHVSYDFHQAMVLQEVV